MSENSKIEWTDHTFNPWIGCQKVGPGCDNCYAESMMSNRLKIVQWGPGASRTRTSQANWRAPLVWNAKHEQFFAKNGRRQRVFCASLADVFDNEVPRQWRQDLFDLILATPNLDWLLLTKRIGNVARMLQDVAEQRGALMDANDRYRPLLNVWIGATVINQAEADRDVPKLLATPARVRFLSMEPLLGPVDLSWRGAKGLPIYWEGTAADGPLPNHCGNTGRFLFNSERRGWVAYSGRGVDWIIVGGESGSGARQMDPAWARSLRDQCAAAGVPFLFKQWGEWAPHDRGRVDTLALETSGALDHPMSRIGKKLAGRVLDGVQHDGFPPIVA